VAIASLKEGIIRPEDEIFSRGYLEIANPYNPEAPSRFVDWKPHGWVNLYSAIARSSNVYFYVLGGGLPKNEYSLSKRGEVKGLGISKLKEYWQLFGLSSKTGIDLPGEKQGFLPDPDIKMKNTKDIWRLGDTYNVSIGQGDLMITPLELLNYISVIGNGGKLMRPFIVKKIFSPKGLVIKENHPEVLKDYSLEFKNYFKEVERGMIDAVSKSYGSAYALSDLPIQIAGKTGSAQIYNNKKTNALFVGYLPVDFLLQAGIPLEKQIAVLILIEEAEAGSVNTLPVAKEIFKWYYENRIKSSEVIL
jgi:penicillin-binding protein 2